MLTNIFGHPKGFTWNAVRLGQEVYFDTLLRLENIHYLFPAEDTVGVPVAKVKALTWLVRLSRSAIHRYEEDNSF